MAAVKARAMFLRCRTRAPKLNSDDGLGCDDAISSCYLNYLLHCQVLPKEDIETLNLCKRMMEKGECPPLMVVFDSVEGFTVHADRYIKDLTIITKYVGDVVYLKNRKNEDGDSMMTLLHVSNPLKSLVICPDKRSNVARFVNGINNFSPDGRKKQNLKCVRKGERLYYDYNGYEHEYPTEHFV
ncbi:hypothetical protein HRI_002024900 [Hibiscus trionum]|uniref:Uncharacterized protein n=1 Tax=Hibiscus trionum TaxID=183268 RepID=A0A9W7M0X9_HIBTR|nr:hypothetical protein HRI_002024900 [Hibiscus trionum]